MIGAVQVLCPKRKEQARQYSIRRLRRMQITPGSILVPHASRRTGIAGSSKEIGVLARELWLFVVALASRQLGENQRCLMPPTDDLCRMCVRPQVKRLSQTPRTSPMSGARVCARGGDWILPARCGDETNGWRERHLSVHSQVERQFRETISTEVPDLPLIC